MKIAPILEEMRKFPDRFEPKFIHTGQHYDDKMSRIFLEELELPTPDVYLGVGSGTHGEQTSRIMIEFEKIVLHEKPDLVLVVGDVNSTLACSLVAAKLHIPVAHVEAGLRSFDRTMPEEINRILTDQISNYLFTTCRDGDENLKKEGVSGDKIHFTGNAMIQSLIRYEDRVNRSKIHEKLNVKPGDYALVTLHRPSNVDDEDTFRGILNALKRIQQQIMILFPAHPRTRKQLKQFGLSEESENGRFMLLEPLGYLDFLSLQKKAGLVLTDSGGIQEETTFYRVPCLTLRHNTERPITIEQGTNILVGTDPDRIVTESFAILDGKVKQGTVPEFWDDKVAERIVAVLEE